MKKTIIITSFALITVISVLGYYMLLKPQDFFKETEKKPISAEEKKQEVAPQENTINTPNVVDSKCNENGKIMILMYHKFSDVDGDSWTRTFSDFKDDLQKLYDGGYRPISMTDYINGNIDVPYGMTPVVLTFDNGHTGQFKFEKIDGSLVLHVDTALNILKDFNEKHPDFKLKGTFYIASNNFFGSTGTAGQKLKFLTDLGFEIGNLTKTYYYLSKAKTAEKVEEEVGGFAKFIDQYLPGYKVNSLSLPGGTRTKTFKQYMLTGEYNGFKYENKAIVSIYNSVPAKAPSDKEINWENIPRIKVNDEKEGLNYWLKYFEEHPEEKYVSDGKK